MPEAIDLAMCPQVYNAELWQARLASGSPPRRDSPDE
jgi:hypothetical protein